MASSPLTFDTDRLLLRDPGIVIAIANMPPTILWQRSTRVSPSLADIGDGTEVHTSRGSRGHGGLFFLIFT